MKSDNVKGPTVESISWSGKKRMKDGKFYSIPIFNKMGLKIQATQIIILLIFCMFF